MTLAVLFRFVHLVSLTLFVGVFAFLLIAGALLAASEHAVLRRLDRRLLRIASWSLAVALISGVALFLAHVSTMTGRPWLQALTLADLGRTFTETQFGRVSQLRLGVVVLLGAFLLFRREGSVMRDRVAFRFEALLLGGALLGALAWAGHAAATEGTGRLVHLGADAVHLVATGAWLGGLIPLALLLRVARAAPDTAGPVAARVARRFSAVALASVLALLVTGLVNAWFLVGDVPRSIGTGYGRVLLLKVAVVVLLLGVAFVNRSRLVARLMPPAVSNVDAAATVAPPAVTGRGQRVTAIEPREALARLYRNVLAEIALGAVVVAIVAVLGVTPPARHADVSWPLSFRLSWQATKDLPGTHLWVIGGSLFGVLGLTALLGAALRRLPRGVMAPLGSAAIVYGAWLALSPLAIDAYPSTYARPTIPYAATSIASGARLYAEHCAVCHGVSGRGDGPAGLRLPRAPADLTAQHSADHTVGDLFWWITHGIRGSGMPGFGDRLDEPERWDLVNFLRALAAGERARSLSARVEPTPWLVAPDFAFGIGVGPEQTLKDHRGWAMVHLVLFTLPGSLARLEQLDRSWSNIGFAGARVVGVPVSEPERVYRVLGARVPNLPMAVEGSRAIVEAYAQFRPPGARLPDHVELLIDRQGYIRARWTPGTEGWEDIPALLREIRWLDSEAPSAPYPDEHAH